MRLVAILALMVVLAALAFVVVTGDGDGGGYQVRAIFDNAAFVIPGEDVKIAGVKVGKIDSLDVTPDNKAAVVLDDQRPRLPGLPRRRECTIRPQSLIGEQFVECTPTQPRAGRDRAAAEAEQDRGRPGQGPVPAAGREHDEAVDLDLVNNIIRLPVRQRLSIILDELGVGLAGRGEDLNDVIRRAAPALKEVDQVLRSSPPRTTRWSGWRSTPTRSSRRWRASAST